MHGNNWLLIQYASHRRAGYRLGATHSAIACALLAAALMIGSYTAIMMRVDAQHERTVALLKAESEREIGGLKKDLARYSDIAQLERDAVAAMEKR